MEAPTPITELVQGLDDETLKQMAQPPQARLFPLLRHASAMRPLIALAAILPALVALRKAPWTQQGSEYALRQIALLTAGDFWRFWELLGVDPQITFSGQTPLPAWLGALSLKALGTDFYGDYVVIQFLSVAGIIGMTFRIAHQLGGMRMGLFSALLIAFQTQTMRLAQEPGPAAPAILLAMVTLWGMNSHWREGIGSLSWRVVVAGLCLGLCGLSGGPLLLMVGLCLVLNRAALDASLWMNQGKDENPQKRIRLTTRGWKSLGFAALIGGVVAAPWNLWMLHRYGTAFLARWWLPLTGVSPTRNLAWLNATDANFTPSVWWIYFPGVILGPLVLGVWDCLREIRSPSKEREIRRAFDGIWLLTWSGIGVAIWLLQSLLLSRQPVLLEMWREFALIPVTILAAWGIIAVADREVSLPWGIAAGLLSAMFTCLQFAPLWLPTQNESSELAVVVAVALALAVTGWWLIYVCHRNELRERRCLSLLMVGIMGLTIGFGIALMPQVSSDALELQELRKDLTQIQTPMQKLVFVTPETIPSELEFAIRSVWPLAETQQVHNWNLAMNATLHGRDSAQKPPAAVIICWDINDSLRFRDLPNAIPVQLATTTRLFLGRELNVFRMQGGNGNPP
ncbi:MAG: hypothetical protein U0903_05210 [Planctomycetales bacterium]